MKIHDLIGNLSDAHIEEALDISDAVSLAEAVRAEKLKKAKSVIMKLVPAAACVCLIAAAAVVYSMSTNKRNDNNMQIANPNRIVSSVTELSEALGTSFPTLIGRNAELCIVTSVDGKVYKTEARYTDGSSLAVGKGTGDISGIYGGTVTGSEVISGAVVEYRSYDKIIYAVWTFGGYSYCYYSSDAESAAGDISASVLGIITTINA